MAARIEDQVADRDCRGYEGGAPARQRPQPREELGERERFDEVVVSTGIQASNAIANGTPSGQDENRGRVPASANVFRDSKTVDAGEHVVENDDVVGVDRSVENGRLAIDDEIDGI